ncbi:hypothetical protein LA635_0689 [Erwinia amylovora LA635]|nr:hypothetical protein LA635_0689 [Erwinia amylovora LA635]CDK17680.1 hypothetical protein LA636_0688 [Erwinia amylovora LA636]CDK21049.1 hypothetical protein LA637_0689 [Erwinia amylovora LA637]
MDTSRTENVSRKGLLAGMEVKGSTSGRCLLRKAHGPVFKDEQGA